MPRPAVGEVHDEDPVRGVAGLEPVDAAVVEDRAAVDEHDAPAQPFHVVEVVRGEDHGGALVPVLVRDERPDAFLGDHVEADGGFVEEEDARLGEHGGGQVAAHALAEGQLPHGGVEERAEAEQVRQAPGVRQGPFAPQPVETADEVEGVAQRQVPPQLGALPEDDADVAGVAFAVLPRHEARDPDPPRGGPEDAGEDLDRGGLAGAVGPEVADEFAFPEREGDAVDRPRGDVAAGEEGAQAAEGTRDAFRAAELLDESVDFDGGSGHHRTPPPAGGGQAERGCGSAHGAVRGRRGSGGTVRHVLCGEGEEAGEGAERGGGHEPCTHDASSSVVPVPSGSAAERPARGNRFTRPSPCPSPRPSSRPSSRPPAPAVGAGHYPWAACADGTRRAAGPRIWSACSGSSAGTPSRRSRPTGTWRPPKRCTRCSTAR